MDEMDIDLALEVLALEGQPTVTPPEELPPIPYEKQNRVPEALLKLEADTAAAAQIDVQRLVLLAGVTGAGGREGALFEVRHDRAVERVAGFLVVYRGGDGRLHLVQKVTRVSALERWEDVRGSIEVISQALGAAE
jgi:hypothetical protein